MRAKLLGLLAGVAAILLSLATALFGYRQRLVAQAIRRQNEALLADATTVRERESLNKTIEQTDRALERPAARLSEDRLWARLHERGRLKD